MYFKRGPSATEMPTRSAVLRQKKKAAGNGIGHWGDGTVLYYYYEFEHNDNLLLLKKKTVLSEVRWYNSSIILKELYTTNSIVIGWKYILYI